MSIGDFDPAGHGWWAAPVKEKAIEAAKERQREGSEARVTPERWNSGQGVDWTGYVGEPALRRWLVELAIRNNGHGGVDALPDVDIGPIGVSVKTRTINGATFRPDWWCPYELEQFDRFDHPEIFFCVYSFVGPTLTLLGGIERERFRSLAEVARAGEAMESGRPVTTDMLRVRASVLERPLWWLARVAR